MPRDKYRGKRCAISISGATYERLQDYAEQNGVTLGDVVEHVTADLKQPCVDPSSAILIVPAHLKARLNDLASANGCTVIKLIEIALGRAGL